MNIDPPMPLSHMPSLPGMNWDQITYGRGIRLEADLLLNRKTLPSGSLKLQRAPTPFGYGAERWR
jgi:hypothetical protein